MKLVLLALTAFILSACSTYALHRAPSSIPKTSTSIAGGTRIVLMQPIPFINTGKKKTTISVVSRKKFTSDGILYSCSLSTPVGKDQIVFFEEGTVIEFKEKGPQGVLNSFQPPQGNSIALTCEDESTGIPKSHVTMEEAQIAFPPDVLILNRE